MKTNTSAKDMSIDQLVDSFENVTRQAIHARIKKFRVRGDYDVVDKLEKAYAIFKNKGYEGGKRLHGRVLGYGIVGAGFYKSKTHKKAYNVWRGILERVFFYTSEKNKDYFENCSVSEDFLSFQNFAKWYYSQPGCNEADYQVDKDLLGGKEYSSENCVLIPREINNFLRKSPKNTRDLPSGVRKNYNRFVVYVTSNYKTMYKGSFKTVEEAVHAWGVFKKSELLSLVEKSNGFLCEKTLAGLLKFSEERFSSLG